MRRIELPAGATHQIVRDYLLFYGYADTLAAFDGAAGLDPGRDPGRDPSESNGWVQASISCNPMCLPAGMNVI